MIKRKNDIGYYINFINRLLIDKDLREETINQIKYFNENGYIVIDDKNLYGKVLEKEGNIYIETKYQNNEFNCNYTEWNGRRKVNINQIDLKNGSIKINKIENDYTKYADDSNENNFSTKAEEKIYDSEMNLIYESELENDSYYESFEDRLVYKDSVFNNNFKLTKTWFIKNGSILRYVVDKNFYDSNTNNKVNEYYSICPGYNKNDSAYYFSDLKPELFNDYMLQKITIEELIDANFKTERNLNVNKQKIK